jgi:hypothetical protein
MQADRIDRQERKPCRTDKADIRDREIEQAYLHIGETNRKETHKRQTKIIQT